MSISNSHRLLMTGTRIGLALVAVAVCTIAVWSIASRAPVARAQSRPSRVTVTRLVDNPLVTVAAPGVGDNVNGPAVIRVPDWVEKPLGRYYMYFAHHMGVHIRLAYADRPSGPWRVYEPGVLNVRDTAFFRPQPDPPEALEDFYTHVASPEVLIDDERKRLILWFHGWSTHGQRWPADPVAAREWARRGGFGQFTQAAESSDGLRFTVQPAISRTSYLRVFSHDGWYYGMSRLGLLSRARDPLAVFESGPNPFRGSPYANRVRHVGLVKRQSRLHVFFTGIGDAPERVLVSTVDLAGDWATWKASEPTDVLRPEAPYECPELPNAPSEGGDIKGRARQTRDPFVFDDRGQLYLFYTICGEQGIAAGRMTID
jgi:hypothetical protein